MGARQGTAREPRLLSETYHGLLKPEFEAAGKALPENRGVKDTDQDRKRRELDCLVVNTLMATMNGLFGASCILGVFRPKLGERMSDELYRQARELLRAAAQTPPAERFQRRVDSGQITAEGHFKAPAPLPSKAK